MRAWNSTQTFRFPFGWMLCTKRFACAVIISGANIALAGYLSAEVPDQGYAAQNHAVQSSDLAQGSTVQGRPVRKLAPQCCNQRADLWGWPMYNAWTPYRKEMNRPRFVGGYIASKIEPTSQEAMAWREHHAQGDYLQHRAGYVKTYYYPKPWEVLPIDPRPAAPLVAEPQN